MQPEPSPAGPHPALGLPSDEDRPSERERWYRMHLSHEADYERLSWLARRIVLLGEPGLAKLAQKWADEHLIISRDLKRKAR